MQATSSRRRHGAGEGARAVARAGQVRRGKRARLPADASGAELRQLMNVGPAIQGDLVALGVHSIAQLARCDAAALYRRLGNQQGVRPDPCVYDTFRAIIHEAQTGEKTPWFAWTAERKRTGVLQRPRR